MSGYEMQKKNILCYELYGDGYDYSYQFFTFLNKTKNNTNANSIHLSI